MKEFIIRFLKRVGLTLFFMLCAAYLLVLSYALPRTVVVNITGTEVKRGIGGIGGDVRYVLAENLDGDALIFRNEDTGWGFPPYFKFDSGTVAATANNLAQKNPDRFVMVRYYGFRLPIISAFPNVTHLEIVDESYENFPLFNIVFLTVNAALFVFLGVKFAIWRRRRRRALEEEAAETAA